MGLPKIRPFAAGPSAAYIWTIMVALTLAVSGSTVKNTISSVVVDAAYAPFYSLNVGIKKILSVYRDNRELLAKVVALTADNARLGEAGRENDRLRRMLNFKTRSKFIVTPAEVVGSPSAPVRGTIWISAGPGEYLEIGSPVITPHGLVGNISGRAGDLMVVRLLWDRDCRVAAIDRRSRAAGLVQWESGPNLALNYVPIDGNIAIGDTIVSSGMGERYPEGIPVGRVQSVAIDSTTFFLSIAVKPFVRFETIEEVFIIQYADTAHVPEITP
jgi:rod shape-determining protein MreC